MKESCRNNNKMRSTTTTVTKQGNRSSTALKWLRSCCKMCYSSRDPLVAHGIPFVISRFIYSMLNDGSIDKSLRNVKHYTIDKILTSIQRV